MSDAYVREDYFSAQDEGHAREQIRRKVHRLFAASGLPRMLRQLQNGLGQVQFAQALVVPIMAASCIPKVEAPPVTDRKPARLSSLAL